MGKFKHDFNVVARTRKEAEKKARGFARSIGMVLDKITAKKKGSARVKGKQVWDMSATFRDKKKRRKK